jgi:hypothetical protein
MNRREYQMRLTKLNQRLLKRLVGVYKRTVPGYDLSIAQQANQILYRGLIYELKNKP